MLQLVHDELIYKRKLPLMLRANIYKNSDFELGDMVAIFLKDGKSKRGKWMSPQQIIEIDTEAGTVTLPDASVKVFWATFEDASYMLDKKKNFKLQYMNGLPN